jgi:mannose-1-phosphate guanylyltransferase
MEDFYCLIMAGGSGTRFWPRSRVAKPKQYLNLFGNESLLQFTIRRFEEFIGKDHIYIVSSQNQKQVLEEQTPEIPRKNLIYEPVGKNTLPCIGLAAMFAEKENTGGIMVVTPSDHLIYDTAKFREALISATKIAKEKNGIVTIGIQPTYPATGYGYVKAGAEISPGEKIRQFKVERFVEKPDEATANKYLKQGNYFWNSGMFIFKISTFLEEVEKFTPELYFSLRKIQAEIGKPDFENKLDAIYRQLENISVDYGIMEHSNNIFLVEGNFGWNDLGSWKSVYQISEKNKDGNGKSDSGEVLFVDAKNSYVHTDEGLVALIGLEDVIVVRDGNAVLVCKREKAEDVKKAVDLLKEKNRKQFL